MIELMLIGFTILRKFQEKKREELKLICSFDFESLTQLDHKTFLVRV